MAVIYAIEDINDLIYVGSTKQKLHQRLTGHKQDKKNNKYVVLNSKSWIKNTKLSEDWCISNSKDYDLV